MATKKWVKMNISGDTGLQKWREEGISSFGKN
jgi:hypothetical protein